MILILAAIGLFGLALCHEVLFLWPFQELRGWITTPIRRPGARASAAHSSHGAALDGPRRSSGDRDHRELRAGIAAAHPAAFLNPG